MTAQRLYPAATNVMVTVLLTAAVIVVTGLGTVAGILAVAIIISEHQPHDGGPVLHMED